MLEKYNCFDCDGERTRRVCYMDGEAMCKNKETTLTDWMNYLRGKIDRVVHTGMLRRYLIRKQ